MTPTEQEGYRQRLTALRDRVRGDVSDVAADALRKTGGEASGNLSNAPLHLADLGTDNYEQEVSLSLLANEQQRLADINAALERLDQGTFGRCEECQREIPRERLEVMPDTRYCVQCAANVQRNGGSGEGPIS